MRFGVNKYLFGKGSVFLFANVLNAAIPFLLLPVLTRALTPEDYGIVSMFTVFLSFTNTFVGLSVHGAINVQYFKLESKRFAEYVTGCLILLIASAMLVYLVVLVFGDAFEAPLGLPHKWMLIAVTTSFFQFLITIRLSIWVVTGSAIKYGALQVSQTFVNATLSLGLIFIVGLFWEGRVIGQSVAILLFGLVAIFSVARSGYVVNSKNISADIKNALMFGLPLIPHVVGGFVMTSTDRVIISSRMDVSAVGIYMVGLQLGQAMALLADSFNKVYAPWVMGNLSDERLDKLVLVKKSYLAMILFLLIGVVWGGAAIVILPFLVGDKFESAKSIIMYMCLGHSITALYYIVTNYIFYAEKTRVLALITFFSASLNVPLTYYLVSHFGIEGAAIAFLIVQIVFFSSTWLLSNKVYPMPWLFFLRRVKNA